MVNTKNQYFIIDFDSTLVQVETLDELANIALAKHPQRGEILKQIQAITKQGMEGKISFEESLRRRLTLFSPTDKDIKILIKRLKKLVTPSIGRNKAFFKDSAAQIYVISGGFKEYILPIVSAMGIDEDHVLANTFITNRQGQVTGFDRKNPLAQNGGKAKAVKKLGLAGEIIVIGDGYTDWEIREAGVAHAFTAFTENVRRVSVVAKADHVAANFDEFLYHHHLPRRLSYPKNRLKVLLLENISEEAAERFAAEGYAVERYKKGLDEAELVRQIKDVAILGIRSRTNITQSVLARAHRLLSIGAFCIGTNQIDLTGSARRGVAVFNAPFSNTRSVVELVLGEIIMLARQVVNKSTKLHQGIWDKSAANCFEVRGKKLGIVGYGNIGTQLSVLAENLGMEVYFYDIVDKLVLGNARRCLTLSELLKTVDIVSVHVDGNPGNRGLVGEREFNLMKDGVLFLNLSRGFVVEIEALASAIKRGKVAGAAIDVFPAEPKGDSDPFSSPLQGLPNVILTPHIGGNTEEAQGRIAEFVTVKLINFINSGDTTLSVNLPNLTLPRLRAAHRFLHIHQNVPGVLAQINNIMAKHSINIVGQYLGTNKDIGYVITDVNKQYGEGVLGELKKIPETIRLRILY